MKKLISLFLIIVLCCTVVACSEKKDNKAPEATDTNDAIKAEDSAENTDTAEITDTTKYEDTAEVTDIPETVEPSEPEAPTVQLNETVSTDTVDFTLEHGKFSYYLDENASTFLAPIDERSTHGAEIGTCFVSLTATISNKDRGGAIAFSGCFDWMCGDEWTVTYNDEEYKLFGYEPDNRLMLSTRLVR